jgi:hypothetical protein
LAIEEGCSQGSADAMETRDLGTLTGCLQGIKVDRDQGFKDLE